MTFIEVTAAADNTSNVNQSVLKSHGALIKAVSKVSIVNNTAVGGDISLERVHDDDFPDTYSFVRAVSTGARDDRVLNTGGLSEAVDLGAGKDLFGGPGGSANFSPIAGGTGDDT